jgi:hypothetical protein
MGAMGQISEPVVCNAATIDAEKPLRCLAEEAVVFKFGKLAGDCVFVTAGRFGRSTA